MFKHKANWEKEKREGGGKKGTLPSSKKARVDN